ncbi:uncharacterized protein [Pithys albifrons albifrons]|uniref:uncharacterized protein n=1 Tax=Pithys albifrons albifrons TaxID=3385563 RepID=UPI003A5D1412
MILLQARRILKDTEVPHHTQTEYNELQSPSAGATRALPTPSPAPHCACSRRRRAGAQAAGGAGEGLAQDRAEAGAERGAAGVPHHGVRVLFQPPPRGLRKGTLRAALPQRRGSLRCAPAADPEQEEPLHPAELRAAGRGCCEHAHGGRGSIFPGGTLCIIMYVCMYGQTSQTKIWEGLSPRRCALPACAVDVLGTTEKGLDLFFFIFSHQD